MKNLIIVILVVLTISVKAQNSKSWKEIKVPMQQTDKLYFWHPDSGFALDNKINALYKTVDGGLSWTKIKQFNEAHPTFNGECQIINFFSPKTIYYTFARKSPDVDTNAQGSAHHWFCRSYDGGTTWEENLVVNPTVPYYEDYITGMYFFDKNKGIIANAFLGNGTNVGSRFYYTEDGGRTQHDINPGTISRGGNGNAFFINEKIVISGNYVTTPGPVASRSYLFQNWDSVKSGIYFSDGGGSIKRDENWCVVGGRYSDDGGKTWKPNGGNYLENYNTKGNEPTYQHFNNEIINYLGNKVGTFWAQKSALNIYFIDLKRVYLDSSSYNYLNKSLFIVDNNIGYIGTDTNVILKSINSGGTKEIKLSLMNGFNSNIATHPSRLKLYPNPATNQLRITDFELLDGNKYTVYTIQGQLLLQGEIKEQEIIIDVSRLASGMYLFKTNKNFSKFTIVK